MQYLPRTCLQYHRFAQIARRAWSDWVTGQTRLVEVSEAYFLLALVYSLGYDLPMLARVKVLGGQSIIYGLGGVLPKAIGFFLIPLYTRYLTPADYGILALTTTISSILVILYEVGLSGAVTRFYYDYLDQPKEMRAYYGTVWVFLTAFSFALSLLLTWRGNEIFTLLFNEIEFYPYGLLTVWISFFTTASVIPLMLFRVREQAPYYVVMTVGRFLVMTLAIIYFVAILFQGAYGSLRGQLLAGMLFFAPFTYITIRNSSITLRKKMLAATLQFSLPLVPHQLSGWVLSVSDRILLERYVSLDQLGLYSLGYRMAMILDLLLLSINMAWAPYFFRVASTEEDAPHTIARIMTYFTVLMLVFSLPVALLSQDLIEIMAAPAFWDAYMVVPVVVLAFIAHGFYFMLVNQLFYAKATRRLALYTLSAAVVNILLNILLMPRYGIMAAAWNTVIGYSLLTILVYFDSRRVYPIPIEYRRIAIALLSALFSYLICVQIDVTNPFLNIFLRTMAMSIFPVMLLLLRFFSVKELKGIKSIPARTKLWLTSKSNFNSE